VNVVVQDESKTANETAKNRHAVITYCDVYGGIYLHVDHIRFIMLCLQQSDPSGPVYVSYNINKYTPPFFRTCTLQMYIIIIIVGRMLDYRFIIANQEPRKTVLLRRTWGRINISLSVFNIYRSVHINKYIFNIIINDICPAGVINDDVDPPPRSMIFFLKHLFRSQQTNYPLPELQRYVYLTKMRPPHTRNTQVPPISPYRRFLKCPGTRRAIGFVSLIIMYSTTI